jgi:hypothetical protein
MSPLPNMQGRECMMVVIRIREVYGNRLAYPVCEHAKVFCRMLRTKTLTKGHLFDIEQLGFVVKVDVTHNASLLNLEHWNGEI